MLTIVIAGRGAPRSLTFDAAEVTIGSAGGNLVILPSDDVSLYHARIVVKDNKIILVDLRSTKGTYFNGRRMTSPMVVHPDDTIYIGKFLLRAFTDEVQADNFIRQTAERRQRQKAAPRRLQRPAGEASNEASPLRSAEMEETERELLQLVHASSDEDAPRLIYADWLIERNDPRGELIALQCRAGALDERGAQREQDLLAKNLQRWLDVVRFGLPDDPPGPPERIPLWRRLRRKRQTERAKPSILKLERGFLALPLCMSQVEANAHDERVFRLCPTVYQTDRVISEARRTRLSQGHAWAAAGVGAQVAIKTLALPSQIMASEPARCRLAIENEAYVLSCVGHEGIPKMVTLAYRLDGTYALICEWLDGHDLKWINARLRELRRGIDVDAAVAIIYKLTSALEALHTATDPETNKDSLFVHREVRPDHVFVTSSGEVKLIDFGWTRSLEPQLQQRFEEHTRDPDFSGLVSPGAIIDDWRFAYLSPEAVAGEQTDQRADLFSVGVVLTELACGRNPFVGESTLHTLRALRDVTFDRSLLSVLPDELSRIIDQTLTRDREERIQSAAQLRRELGLFLQARGVQPDNSFIAHHVEEAIGPHTAAR